MSGAYPQTDTRRKHELLAQLEAVSTRYVPAWRGLTEPQDPGRALLQIAADLAEHVSTRLDATAKRDIKAFLNWLELPGVAPTAAEAWLVFALGDKLESAVRVRDRIQVGASAEDGKEVIFETSERLTVTLTPARLERVFAVDPASDRIETAPSGFGSLEPGRVSDPRYELLSLASEGGATIQITPPTDLGENDWIQIGEDVHLVVAAKDGIYGIEPSLERAAPAGTRVTRVRRFEPGAMRDLQTHAFYLGHKELLNLERPAELNLTLHPPGRAAWLAARELAWELWAKAPGTDEPTWQSLTASASVSSVRLRKSWVGTTEERKIAGETSRWLRARLRAPMDNGALPLRCDRISMTLRSAAGSSPSAVSTAFHNATPLPVPGPMMPFGSEPRLFDQFLFAAPEALSKKGARVVLDIAVADASFVVASPILAAGETLLGIGANAQVQMLRDAFSDSRKWQALPGPDLETFGLAESGARRTRFSKQAPALLPSADTTKIRFVVQEAPNARRFWRGEVDPGAGDLAVAWYPLAAPLFDELPPAPGLPFTVVADGAGFRLLLAIGAELTSRGLNAAGYPLDDWLEQGTDPAAGAIRSLVPIRRSNGALSGALVLRTENDEVRLLPAPDATGSVRIGVTDEKLGIDALRTDNATIVAFAEPRRTTLRLWTQEDGSPTPVTALRELAPDRDDATLPLSTGLLGGSRTAILEMLNGVPGPHVAFLERIGGRPALRAWRVGTDRVVDIGHHPGVGAPSVGPVALADGAGDQRLVIGDDDQRVRLVDPGSEATRTLTNVVLRNAILVPQREEAFFAELEPDSTEHAIWPVVRTGAIEDGKAIALIDLGAAQNPTNDAVKLWRDRAGDHAFTGAVVGDNALGLDPDDDVTLADRIITLERRKYHVDSIADGPDGRVASLEEEIDPMPPDPSGASYRSITFESLQSIARGRAFALPEAQRSQAPKLSTSRVNEGDSIAVLAVVDGALVVLDTASDEFGPATVDIHVLPGGDSWQTLTVADAGSSPELSWEYYDGDGWRRLDDAFTDTTAHLSTSGQVAFDVPDRLSTTTVGGKNDYWIRVRLIGGDYGQPSYDSEVTFTGGNPLNFEQKVTIDRSNIHAPVIQSIGVSFHLEGPLAPELVLVENNLAQVNQSAAAQTPGAVFDLFASAATIDPEAPQRALYLAFSKPFTAEALRLLVEAAEQQGRVPLTWDAFAEGRWRRVWVANDGTHGLLRSGVVELNVAMKVTRRALFGHSAFWLRARAARGTSWHPDLGGVFPNALAASEAETVRQELLGSSTGEPDTLFRLSRRPILPESVRLRVRERLGDEERAALVREGGGTVVLDDLEDLPGTWVRWKAVDSFIDAKPDARIYVLDPLTGIVQFGDDRHGRIPPAGTDNLRAFEYRTGGGRRGNLAAHTVTGLKSALRGVEAVTNPLPSRGGSDGRDELETVAQATAIARHQNRAVAPRDIEALALGFAPEIRAVRCLRPERADGKVIVAVAVSGPDRTPSPSVSLKDGLTAYLSARAASSWPGAIFLVVGPEYVRFRVRVVLTPGNNPPPALVASVAEKLRDLLHPVTGGREGRGWAFGRGLWPSDIHRALACVSGDTRIAELDIARVDGRGPAGAIPGTGIVAALAEDIVVELGGGAP